MAVLLNAGSIVMPYNSAEPDIDIAVVQNSGDLITVELYLLLTAAICK